MTRFATSKDGEQARQPVLVTTRDGVTGRVEAIADDRVLVVLEDGRQIVVAPDVLERNSDGSYLLSVPAEQAHTTSDETLAVVPVTHEELVIGKRMVETDRGVRIHKRVSERQQKVVQFLYREDLDVQHVPKNEVVDRPPPVRHEGATIVIPLCEEVLVIEKRLILREEVRVTRRGREIQHTEELVVRSEHAAVERFGDQSDVAAAAEPSTTG
jgi:uncharacterized protein (TIGR02271 family)